ncbi:Pfs domain protein [Aspergillus pseudoustus]|uniref:Pfs domain protein n=1 Tax=Aspergillus pseudoustus TaxID=1810923 RepID=A0ABR4JTI6_9EURO
MPPRMKRLRHRDYTIGWICAIAVEREAAVAVLDATHPPLSVAHNDKNTYTLGSIGPHNVVICCLPPGIYGLTAATTVANHMISTFAEIKATLMVGIGGGAPSRTTDIRLGDVVVSTPTESSPAVMQYDRGKTTQKGFVRSGILDKPSWMLSTAVGSLQVQHKQHGSLILQILSEMQAQQPRKWMPPTVDDLFDSTYEHAEGEETCANCDRTKLVPRGLRNGTMPVIHYGLIASANQVMKHGRTRDKLQKEFGILCFEMEGAGLMNDMQCLVVRGICDYSDSHKNKAWQSFAAATAAAYAKELLGVVPLRHRTHSPPSST